MMEWENFSARTLLKNIKMRNPKCITISSELKILPIILFELALWIIVLEAIMIGEIARPNKNVSMAATVKLGYLVIPKAKTTSIHPLKIKETNIVL